MKSLFAAFCLTLLTLGTLRAADLPDYTPDSNHPRSAVPAAYTWDLKPLFDSDASFEAGLIRLRQEIPALAPFSGRLADPATLFSCLDLYFRLHNDANKLTLYANLRQSTALTDDTANALVTRSLAAMDELMQAATFIRREVLALPVAQVAAAITAEPQLAPYQAYIENLQRRSSRVLSADGERALGLLGDNLWAEIDLNELPSGHEDTFGAVISEMALPKVKDATGKEVQLTLSNFGRLRASSDREVRRTAVAGLFGTLRKHEQSLASTLAGQVRLNVAYARARGYDTALAAYLDKDNVSPAVYDNLVSAVNANLPLLHRYVELRKKALGLADIRIYDLYIPIVAGVEKDIPFSEAQKILPEALKPLGAEYGQRLVEGLDPKSGWLDLFPHQDKRSGAFSASTYGPHPWVFMNYQNSLDDMSTLAHEYGHALHSDLAMKAQSYPDYRYTTLLAEIASTCNEMLLSDYLVARADSEAEKAYLLVERLESIRTTIFRQTMFAEFERAIHTLHEQGVPLTAAKIEATYRELVQRYYGPGFTVGADDGLEWAYIPHFYYKYYVYSYATGLSSGIAIADRVRELGEPAVQAYLGMLKGGCAKAPLELLKDAGVDLTTPAPVEAAMKTFERTLDEVEQLLAKR